MTIKRWAAKRDANEAGIIKALRGIGAFVVQLSATGAPDLLVVFRGRIYLLEVKMPKTGRVQESQKVFHEQAGFLISIVTTADEALRKIGAID